METIWNIIQNRLPLDMNLMLENGLPMFEIRFDKDLNPTGDFYVYGKRKKSFYNSIIRFDENLQIKEFYESISKEEFNKWGIEEYIEQKLPQFASKDINGNIIDVYWYTNMYPVRVSRINKKGARVNYKTYSMCSKNIPYKEQIILDNFNSCFIYSYIKENEIEPYGYSVNIPRPTESYWEKYTIIKHNINKLRTLDILKDLLKSN